MSKLKKLIDEFCPNGVKSMKLGEVCDINYGTRVVQKKDGGSIYPVYGGGGATFRMDTYNREDCLVVARFAMSPKCTRIVKGKFFLQSFVIYGILELL